METYRHELLSPAGQSIRLVLFDDGFKLVRSGAQAVILKETNFIVAAIYSDKECVMVAEFRFAYRLLLSDLIDSCNDVNDGAKNARFWCALRQNAQ